METNESIVREKAEINLSSFFWSILAQWRIILVFALLFALLLGGVKGVQSYRSLNNTAKQEAAQKKYQEELDAYNIQKAKLELEIETLTQDSLRLQEYEDSSVLFSIDPYHVHVEQALYYISLDHDSFLENALQNDIYTAPLIDAYSVAIARTDIVSLISGLENRAVSNEYGRLASTDANTGGAGAQTVSFLSVSANSDSGVLEVRAIGGNEEQARLFLDAAREEMAKVKSSLEESIHQHEIVLLSTKQFQIVSKELIELHNSFLKQTESIDNSLKTNRKCNRRWAAAADAVDNGRLAVCQRPA